MRNKLIFAASLLINLNWIIPLFGQDIYIIQAEKSKINVSAKYLVASKLTGSFKDFEGFGGVFCCFKQCI